MNQFDPSKRIAEPTAHASPSPIARTLWLSAAAAMALLGYSQYRLFFHDDAYISLRYWLNFSNGHGLVWNPGEAVEGYTNFLFLALTGLLSEIGIGLPSAAQILGIVSFVALCLYVWSTARRFHGESTSHTLLPTLLTAASLPLIIWSLSGLETVFFALLSTAAVWTFSLDMDSRRSGARSGLLFALAVMTRPDGVVLLGASGLYGTLGLIRRGRPSFRFLFTCAGSFLLVYGPYFAWRCHYYGDLFPNTFYVKGEFGLDKAVTGAAYLWDFAVCPPYLLPATAALAAVAISKRKTDARISHLTTVAGFFLLYVVFVGGDHMPAFRFFAPIVPTLALLLSLSLDKVFDLERRRVGLVYLFALLFCSLQFLAPPEILSRAKLTDRAAFVGEIVGRHISENWPAGSLIAVSTAGSTPYFAPQNIYIDMLGLNDRHIAHRPSQDKEFKWKGVPGHEKGDGRYVLSRQPDFIIVGPASGMRIDFPWFLSDVEMLESSEFHENYRIRYVFIDIRDVENFDLHRELSQGRLPFVFYERVRESTETGPASEASNQ